MNKFQKYCFYIIDLIWYFSLGMLLASIVSSTGTQSNNSSTPMEVDRVISSELKIINDSKDYPDFTKDIEKAIGKVKLKNFGTLKLPNVKSFKVPVIIGDNKVFTLCILSNKMLHIKDFGLVDKEHSLKFYIIDTELNSHDVTVSVLSKAALDSYWLDSTGESNGWTLWSNSSISKIGLSYPLDEDNVLYINAWDESRVISKESMLDYCNKLISYIDIEESDSILLSTYLPVEYLEKDTGTKFRLSLWHNKVIESWKVVDEDLETNCDEYNQLKLYNTSLDEHFTIKEYWDKTLSSYKQEMKEYTFTATEIESIPVNIVTKGDEFIEIVVLFKGSLFTITSDNISYLPDAIQQKAIDLLNGVGNFPF